MPAFALLECSADAADVPGVCRFVEEIRIDIARFLRAEKPDIIGQLALGIGANIGIGRLPRAGDAHGVGIECQVRHPRIGLLLGEVQNVRVALGKHLLGLLAEGVMPDDPVAHVEADLPPRDMTQISGKLIADRKIE